MGFHVKFGGSVDFSCLGLVRKAFGSSKLKGLDVLRGYSSP